MLLISSQVTNGVGRSKDVIEDQMTQASLCFGLKSTEPEHKSGPFYCICIFRFRKAAKKACPAGRCLAPIRNSISQFSQASLSLTDLPSCSPAGPWRCPARAAEPPASTTSAPPPPRPPSRLRTEAGATVYRVTVEGNKP